MSDQKATFYWQVDIVEAKASVGWVAFGKVVAVEMTMDEFEEKGPKMVESLQKAHTLTVTLQAMRRHGATIDEMNGVLVAIQADGGL